MLPLRQNFDSFIELFKESFKTKLIIDNDFNVLFEKSGELHPFNHLSQGQRCALSLCFRLSLSHQIYGNEFVLFFDVPYIKEEEGIVNIDKELELEYDVFKGLLLINGKKVNKIELENKVIGVKDYLNELFKDEY